MAVLLTAIPVGAAHTQGTAPEAAYSRFDSRSSSEQTAAQHYAAADPANGFPSPIPADALAPVETPAREAITGKPAGREPPGMDPMALPDAPRPPAGTGRDSASSGDTSAESAPPSERERIPLERPGSPQDPAASTASQSGVATAVTTAGGLVLVLGLFLAFAWLMRRVSPKSMHRIPGEAVEVLGRAPLNNRQQLCLIRCGGKLILVAVSDDGAETLTEITDAVEVDRLAGLCEQARGQSPGRAFRQVLGQFSREEEHLGI